MSFEAPTLTYTGEEPDQKTVKDAITITSSDISTDDFDIVIKQGGEDNGFWAAGTYDVYIYFTESANYTGWIESNPDGIVKIGAVTIDKYQPEVANFELKGDLKQEYYGGGIGIEGVDIQNGAPLNADCVEITYKDKDGNPIPAEDLDKDGCPINAGTYKIYIAYHGDENIADMKETDSGETLTITKIEASPTLSPYVVYKTTTEPQKCGVSEYLKQWGVSEAEFATLQPSVTVDADDNTCIDSESLEYADGEICFTLTEAAKELTENTTVNITVDFKDALPNWKAKLTIPVVISSKYVVNINVMQPEDLEFAEKAKELTYHIYDSNEEGTFEELVGKTAAEIGDNFKVTIKKDGEQLTKVDEIKDVGWYVVSAVYEDEQYYGEVTDWVEVGPKMVDSLTGLMTLSASNLAYTGEDQADAVKKLIKVNATIEDNEYTLRFRKNGVVSDVIIDEGTYEVIAYWLEDNSPHYQWSMDGLTIGQVTIGTAGGSTGSNTGGSTGGSTTPSTPSTSTETKPDGTKVETSTETKPDGTKVDTVVETATDGTKTETIVETSEDDAVKTTEIVTATDGSATKTENEKETNEKGKEVEVTTTTKTDSTGAVTSVTEKSVIASSATTSTTVTVKKDGAGEITSAKATIAKTVSSGNKATISAGIIDQITEAAGTDQVKVTMSVKDADGATKYNVKVDAADLTTGNALYIYKLNTKTGEYTMVDAKTYKVSKTGNVAVSMTKKAGTVTVKAKVTLKNGTTKTIKMKITVK